MKNFFGGDPIKQIQHSTIHLKNVFGETLNGEIFCESSRSTIYIGKISDEKVIIKVHFDTTNERLYQEYSILKALENIPELSKYVPKLVTWIQGKDFFSLVTSPVGKTITNSSIRSYNTIIS